MSRLRDGRSSSAGSHGQSIQVPRLRRTSAYVLGVASGLAVALFAPLLRPAAQSAVKGGILIGRHAKKVAANLQEEFEDIAAEARADIDREEQAAADQRDA